MHLPCSWRWLFNFVVSKTVSNTLVHHLYFSNHHELWYAECINSWMVNFFFLNIRLHFLQMKIIYHLNLELEKLQRFVPWAVQLVQFCESVFLKILKVNFKMRFLYFCVCLCVCVCRYTLWSFHLKSDMVRTKSVNNHTENQASCDKIFKHNSQPFQRI